MSASLPALTVSVDVTEAGAFAALRAFLLAILPPGVGVYRGQGNRVPEPAEADFVILSPVSRVRLGTNVVTHSDPLAVGATGPGTRLAMEPTELTIQADVHGPQSANNAQIIATLLRDEYGCRLMGQSGYPVQPLYASDPTETPFINGENQVEYRWTVDAVLQINVTVSMPQDFASTVSIGVIDVDVAYPADGSAPPMLEGGVTVISLPPGVTPPSQTATAGAFAATIVGDGLKTQFAIQHPLGTTDVVVEVRDPNDQNAQVPGVDNLAPDPGTVLIVLAEPLADGAELRVIIRK